MLYCTRPYRAKFPPGLNYNSSSQPSVLHRFPPPLCNPHKQPNSYEIELLSDWASSWKPSQNSHIMIFGWQSRGRLDLGLFHASLKYTSPSVLHRFFPPLCNPRKPNSYGTELLSDWPSENSHIVLFCWWRRGWLRLGLFHVLFYPASFSSSILPLFHEVNRVRGYSSTSIRETNYCSFSCNCCCCCCCCCSCFSCYFCCCCGCILICTKSCWTESEDPFLLITFQSLRALVVLSSPSASLMYLVVAFGHIFTKSTQLGGGGDLLPFWWWSFYGFSWPLSTGNDSCYRCNTSFAHFLWGSPYTPSEYSQTWEINALFTILL